MEKESSVYLCSDIYHNIVGYVIMRLEQRLQLLLST